MILSKFCKEKFNLTETNRIKPKTINTKLVRLKYFVIYYLTNKTQTVDKFMKTVKKLSLLLIAIFSIAALSSCSSGSSSSEGSSGPLNLTGNWRGTVTFIETGVTSSGSTAFIADSGRYSATMTIVQDIPVTLADTSDADFILVVTSPDGCTWTLSVDGATVNGRTRSISANDDDGGFVGTASNSSISGTFSPGDDAILLCGFARGRADFRRE